MTIAKCATTRMLLFVCSHLASVLLLGADFPAAVEDLMNALDGGESKTITIEIPLDQEPGLFWYHNHFHGKPSSTVFSWYS